MGEIGEIRVFAAMVADLFHFGHVNFLREARRMGDHLTVGLVSDRRAATYKRSPVMTFAERKAVVDSCRYVDAVIELDENVTDAFMRARGFQIRAYAVANDEEEARNFRTIWKDMSRDYFRRIDYSPDISSTEVIARILSRTDLRPEAERAPPSPPPAP